MSINSTNNTVHYETNAKSDKAFKLIPLYADAVNLLNYSIKFPEEGIGPDAFNALEKVFIKYKQNFGLSEVKDDTIEHQVLKHIEGVIAAPIIVLLGLNGFFHKYFMEASFRAQEYHKNPESFKKNTRFLGLFRLVL